VVALDSAYFACAMNAPAAEAGDVARAARRTVGYGRHTRFANRGRPYFPGLDLELRSGVATPITLPSSSSAA
jgi:hypothetical protein